MVLPQTVHLYSQVLRLVQCGNTALMAVQHGYVVRVIVSLFPKVCMQKVDIQVRQTNWAGVSWTSNQQSDLEVTVDQTLEFSVEPSAWMRFGLNQGHVDSGATTDDQSTNFVWYCRARYKN